MRDYLTNKKGAFTDTFGFCSHCKHKDPNGAKCKSFPKGIPVEIRKGEHDHNNPYPGDNGIMFEPVEEGK